MVVHSYSMKKVEWGRQLLSEQYGIKKENIKVDSLREYLYMNLSLTKVNYRIENGSGFQCVTLVIGTFPLKGKDIKSIESYSCP